MILVKHLWVAAAVAVAAVAVGRVESLRCTSDHLASFKETTIAAPVNKCASASEVQLTMPPIADLTETQRDQICSERICKDMIAAIDDMDVPRCDLLYNGKNVTLQTSLDRFTSICDTPRSKAPEVKKKKTSGNVASAASASAVGSCVTVVVGSLMVLAASVF